MAHHAQMEPRQKWFVIVNSSAGGGGGARRWHALARALAAAGVDFEAVETHGPRDGRRLAAAARATGRRCFLVVGGDGSVHDVVNGIGDGGVTVLDSVVGVAPCGTGNDWARTLGMPRDPDGIAAAVAAGHTIPHDIGELRFPQAGPGPTLFVNHAGAGIDAEVVLRLPRRLPRFAAYPRATLAALRSFVPPCMHVSGDGIDWRGPRLVVFATIGRYCGGGMHVASRADVRDGLLEVVAIDAMGIPSALRRLPKLYRGRIADDPRVTSARAAALSIESAPPCGVEADGQWIGETPVRVTVRPSALRVLVPAAQR